MSNLVRPSTRVVVMLWYMRGCGHCEEIAPRFKRLEDEFRSTFQSRGIQVLKLDAAAPALQPLADRFDVQATPTMIAAQRNGGMLRLVGVVSDRQLRDLFEAAVWA